MPAGPRRGASTSLDTNGKNGGSADWFRLKAAVRPSPESRRDAEIAEGKRENLCVLCVSARNVWKAASERLQTFLSPSSSEEGGVGSVGPPDRPEQSGGLFTRRRWWRAIARKTSSTTPLRLGREAPKSRCTPSEEEGGSQCLNPPDRKSVLEGTGVSVSVDLGGAG